MTQQKPEDLIINTHWNWNWRAIKKYSRNLSAKIKKSGYFEDCNCAPCRLTDIYYDNKNIGYDVSGIDLFTGNPSGCSIFHCAPVPLSREQAEERVDYKNSHGEQAYRDKYLLYDYMEEK